MADFGPLRNERDVKRANQFSDEELLAANANSNPADDARRNAANLVEIRKEIARAKDPKIKSILQEEYGRLQSESPNAVDGVNEPAPMDFKVLGAKGVETPPPPADVAPMRFRLLGSEPAPAQPDVTASPAQAVPGAPQYVGTNEGAVTGIERPRKAGPEPTPAEVGPLEKRMGIEGAATATGAILGATLGGVGEPAGAGAGATFGSLLAEPFDPTEHPMKEALTTGATAAATGGLSVAGVGGIRYMLGSPTKRGQALLDILEARGLVPPAGAVLSGSLVKNMEAIGSADAFFGQKVKQMVADSGGAVTDDLRNFVNGYERFYGAAKQGFKIWDEGVKSYLPGEAGNIVALDRGVIDKLAAADRVWAGQGAATDFPLRQVIDRIKAEEADGTVINSFRVNLEQAEAVRQLLYQQAAALSGTARTATTQAVGKDVAQAVRKAANQVGDDMESAIDLAVKDGKIPLQTRQILLASKDMWKQWKVGETMMDALSAQLKTSARSDVPLTSDVIRSALTQIEADGEKVGRLLIGKPETARLEAIANALQANEEAGRASQFTMAVRSGQLFTLSGAGVAAGSGSPGMAATALSVTLIPAMLGFIVRNPTASALLIRGLRVPAGSAAAMRASRDLTMILAKEGFIAPVERKGENAD